jgi:hypothetical protein
MVQKHMIDPPVDPEAEAPEALEAREARSHARWQQQTTLTLPPPGVVRRSGR